MIVRLAAHRHPLTLADCNVLRRIALPTTVFGTVFLLLLIIRALAAFEAALAAASGV